MIKFETIRWKNFLATGNSFTEVKIDASPSHLVVGSNGAGKSTMLDALCFVLFNKPFRKINKSQLINSINESGTVVEIEFGIGSVKYKVNRGIKPNVFEIFRNGTLLDQDAASKDYQKYLEQSILKFNYKSFTQVVILGSSTFVPFMQLGASVRREVIEDLLDIQVFSRMNNLLKDRMKTSRETISNCEHELKLASSHVDMQMKTISQMEKMNKEHLATAKKRMSEINNRTEHNKAEVQKLTDLIASQSNVQQEYDELKDMRVRIQTNLEKADKDLKFYWENDNCPTCNQVLKDKSELIAGASSREKKFSEGLAILTDTLNRAHKTMKELNGHSKKIVEFQSENKGLDKEFKKLKADIIKEAPDIATEKTQLLEFKTVLADTEERCAKVNEDMSDLKVVQELLKDGGIKSKIISKFIPIINQLINKYLQSMDFFVNFTLDEEFNEVIKSRFRDDFSYASFSEGEKQKIDLALLFTWREIAKLKNSASTNLLILDEVFDSSLDDASTDELLKILKEFGDNVNLFVISHKGELLLDKFNTTLRFTKVNDFSKLAAS